MEKDILHQTKRDLLEDFEQLLFLFSSSEKKLKIFLQDLKKVREHISSYDFLVKQANEYVKTHEVYIREIKKICMGISSSKTAIEHYVKAQKKYFELYRNLLSLSAGLITATDWQSPSVQHSQYSQAGRQTGKIIVSYSDYKRDYHLDVRTYETQFKKAYIDGLLKFRIPIYLTNSGMAALTTILNFLEMERKITGPILLGTSSYFQNKELIKKLFTGVIEVHEHETEKITEIIKTKNPSVYFFDTLCNSYDIAVPNLIKILEVIKQTAKKDVYVVLDNTCLAASFQPLQLLGKLPKHVHMIVFESMNKYYQFGADKTIGGIIYTWGKDTEKFFYTRQHSGTIIPDINVFQLPTPNKKILLQRLSRHERNASILINGLNEYKDEHPHAVVEKIVYPTLPSHPAYSYAKTLSFHGSFFTFVWKKKYDTIKSYKKFLALVMEKAKKRNIQLVIGTSFGMNTSRIYLTAPNTKFGKPFVRFSVGTESLYEIEKVKQVLIQSLENL